MMNIHQEQKKIYEKAIKNIENLLKKDDLCKEYKEWLEYELKFLEGFIDNINLYIKRANS